MPNALCRRGFGPAFSVLDSKAALPMYLHERVAPSRIP